MPKPILLCGEAYGANEWRTQTPFVGASGVELLRMLDEAAVISLSAEDHNYIQLYWQSSDPIHIDMIWRMHPEVARTNVFNLHPVGNRIETLCGPKAEGIPGFPAITKSKYLLRRYSNELDRLADFVIDLDPDLIVCLGNTPLWAFTGSTGISKLRGTTRLSTHTAAGFKLLPTYHPAAVLRQWELRPTTVMDLVKAGREAAFPEIRRPEREIWIDPTLEDIREFKVKHLDPADRIAVDIETAGNQITRIGFAPSRRLALVIPFTDSRRVGRSYWPSKEAELEVWNVVREVLGDRRTVKVLQNGLYDIAFLLRSVGIAVYGPLEDTMLLHHALHPESLKSLGFLGSIYSDESAWKQERKKTRTIKRDE